MTKGMLMQIPLCSRLFAVLSRSLNFLSDLRLAVRLYQTNWVTLLRRLAYLHSHGGFRPGEALQDGLLDMRVPESALAATLSKRALVELQARVNPTRYDCLTEDKAIFYAYCGALGLPIPRLFGVAARPVGFSAEGRPLRDAADWQTFVAGLPNEFVVKPSQGVYGWGVEIFRRDDGGFVGSSGGRYSKEDMSDAFFTDPRYSSFVIQERLYAHPAMQELSGTPYLQTLRIVTDVDEQGTSHIVFAFLRIIAGEVVVDNYASGTNGNLLCFVDLAEGTLDLPIGPAPNGIGAVQVPQHPRTGVPFKDFRLPDWEAACALANRAAVLFLPMHSLGWDIALTPDGPRIVEVNKRWDPCSELMVNSQIPGMTDGLVQLLARLRNAPRR